LREPSLIGEKLGVGRSGLAVPSDVSEKTNDGAARGDHPFDESFDLAEHLLGRGRPLEDGEPPPGLKARNVEAPAFEDVEHTLRVPPIADDDAGIRAREAGCHEADRLAEFLVGFP